MPQKRSVRRRPKSVVSLALAAELAGGAALAQTAPANNAKPPSSAPSTVAAKAGPKAAGGKGRAMKVTSVEGITEYRLPNGLQVLLFPDQSKPTVTVNVTYFVGSRVEGYGESGMAHLLEHMLFKGTPKRPDVWKLLQDHGAKFNGTTWYDRTNYYEELSATQENLDFALDLEADRMLNSKIAAEDLAKEFSVVRNEFEMGENNPPGVLEEKMLSTAFQWHNYGKSTIGSRSDIERVPIENLRAFYKHWYQPDNAMLIVAGKFDETKTLARIEKLFGALPRPARKLPASWTEEPVQDGAREVTLRRTGDVAVVAALYHAVAGADPDWIVSDALTDVLTNKPAGRLYKAVVETGLASEVYGYVYPTADPGIIYVGAKVRPGGSPEKVRDAMLKVVEGLGAAKVEEGEVDRWRTRSLKEFELALTETSSVGVALSDWAAMGDWRLFFLTRDRVKAVKAADVSRVAGNFLKETNRTLGMFLPTKAPDRAPLPPRPDVAALMKDYKGGAAVAQGEVFAATLENVEKRSERTALPGGAKLGLLPKKTKGGAVRALLTFRFGSEGDLKGKTAAADVLPAMLMRGTKKHTFQQLKDELDRLRAEVGFGMGSFSPGTPGVAHVRIKTVRESLPAVLSLLTEILREPAFPKAEFETLRKESLAQMEEQLQDPMANGFSALLQKIQPAPRDDVRYMKTVKENIDDLKALDVGQVAKLHATLWGAGDAQISVVGDFDAAAVKAQLAKELGGWKAGKPYARVTLPFKEGVVADQVLETPEKQMALVAVGHPLEMRDDDPDYPALVLLNHVFGGSASSRLLNRLRQKEGISYSAFSGMNARPLDKSGFFFAGAICAPQNADKAMAGLLEELQTIIKEPIPAKELADAKKSYAAGFDNKLADDDFVSGELAQGLFIGRTFERWKQINEKIQKLTAAEVQAVAKKYLRPEKLAKVKAGDLAKKAS